VGEGSKVGLPVGGTRGVGVKTSEASGEGREGELDVGEGKVVDVGLSVGVFPDWISTDSSIDGEGGWDEVTPALQAAARIARAIIAVKTFLMFIAFRL